MLLPAIYKISQLLTRAYIRTLESDTTAICPMKIGLYIYHKLYASTSNQPRKRVGDRMIEYDIVSI